MAAKNKNPEDIFNKAIEISDFTKRAEYLDEACGGDEELRAEVEVLLKAHDKAGDFLEVPPFTDGITYDDAPITEIVGTVIGRYKLLEKIGEGGMAVVYMAQQEKPVNRKVAFKIIKLGMDTKQVIARFEAERQVLAMMDHPNIAKVFDAGTTETGRPYFVMELIRGIPITEYCDKNNLNTKERLYLFIQICNSVQHAHQKGIIHRDIKPSNVLVTLQDGKPVPIIIDFGIAKATSQRLTEKTLFTRFAQMIGTPEYMSPEQAEMSRIDIDTRSDIYSLGVLLYELLTGILPFDIKKLREAGYAEMQRVIREEEPDKPSTKLSTLGKTITEIAKHRKTNPESLTKLIRGDLDWIIMKALEKDRTQRYETASEFGMDVMRYLSNELVHASPPSMIYKTRKYIRRHRTSFAFGLVFIASIIIGILLAITGFMQASRQRDLAELNFKKAREAVDQMLTLVAEELPRLPGISRQLDSAEVTKIKQALLESALKYYEGFLEERSSDLNIRYETAHAYMRVGDISRSMNKDERAEETYFAAANLLEELLADFPNEFEYHKDLAFTYHGYGDMLRNAGRIKEKNDIYRKSAISYENAFKRNQNDAYCWFDCANVYHELGQPYKAISDLSEAIKLNPNSADYWLYRANLYKEIGQWDKAKADYLTVIGIYSKAIDLDPTNTWNWSERADVYRQLEQWDKALADSSKALELDPGNAHYWSGRADVYRDIKQFDKALADYSKAIELDIEREEYYWRSRGWIYVQMEQWDEALAEYYKTIELAPGYMENWNGLIEVYRKLGQLDKVIDDLSKAIELNPGNADFWTERADVYRELEQYNKALTDYSKAIELDPNDSRHWIARAHLYIELEQFDMAIADFTQNFRIVPDKNRDGYPDNANFLNNFAWFLATCPSAEIRDGTRAIEYANQACILTNWQNALIIDTLAAAHAEAGDFDSAVDWQKKAIDLLTEDTSNEVRTSYESNLRLYQNNKPFIAGREETTENSDIHTNEIEDVLE